MLCKVPCQVPEIGAHRRQGRPKPRANVATNPRDTSKAPVKSRRCAFENRHPLRANGRCKAGALRVFMGCVGLLAPAMAASSLY